jgi:hypothetical protein
MQLPDRLVLDAGETDGETEWATSVERAIGEEVEEGPGDGEVSVNKTAIT